MKRSIAAAGLIGALALPVPLDAAAAAPEAAVQSQAVLLPAAPQAAEAEKVSKQDVRFLKANAQRHLSEIATGTYAAEHGASGHVRHMGEHFAMDHAAALKRLKKRAARLGVTLPTAPSAKQQAIAAAQQTLTGAEFDLRYVKDTIAAHKLAIAKTREQIRTGTGLAQAFAEWYLPKAQEHLRMARKHMARLKQA